MEPTSTPARRVTRDRSTARRLARSAVSAVVAAVASVTLAHPVGVAGAAAPTTLLLSSQSTVTAPTGTFSIALHVRSATAPASLGVRFRLYSALSTRSAFHESTANTEIPAESCLDTSAIVPLSGLTGSSTDGVVQYAIPLAASAPSYCYEPSTTFGLGCESDCLDDFPLSVQLVDQAQDDLVVGSFTTHVVVAASTTTALPLKVGIVSELGSTLALSPNGTPTLGSSLAGLSQEVSALANTRDRLSLQLYPDLILALQRDGGRKATALLSSIDALVSHARSGARVELLSAPFADVDASALAARGLAGEVSIALSDGRNVLGQHYGRTLPYAPYVTSSAVDSRGLAALQTGCLSEFVVPATSIAAASSSLTPTAPVIVGRSGPCADERQFPEAFVADPQLDAELATTNGDPVLAGENVLADLAQVFLDDPFDADSRGVVLLANEIDPAVLQVVLDGLHDNPILATTQLENLFDQIPPGSNDSTASSSLSGTPGSDAPTASAIATARTAIRAVSATMPNNRSLISSLKYTLVVAESSGLNTAARQRYLSAPANALLRTVGSAITFGGTGEVTLTARTGKIPITIESAINKNGPINVRVHLSSTTLVLGSGSDQTESLASRDKDLTVTVGTHTSGASSLDVVIYDASGRYVLAREVISVRSTAVSVAAITLSVAALLVLLGWWSRSIVRTRRKRAASAVAT